MAIFGFHKHMMLMKKTKFDLHGGDMLCVNPGGTSCVHNILHGACVQEP